MRLVGLDVGGTKVSVAVLDGAVLSEPILHPTETSSTAALLDQLEGAVRAAAPDGVDGVGIGVPSVVDARTGAARYSVNVPLADVPLREVLTERLGVPVFVDNDANVAALAEARDDEDLSIVADPLVMVTVGTGVGGGIVLGGRIFRGATGASAELGHIIVAADLTDGAPPAGDGPPHPDSLEAHASGRALDALGRERGFAAGPEVVAAAEAGDPRALDALRILGERVGIGVANLVNLLDPELVVVGGGVSAAGELLLEPVRESAARFILPGVGTRTTIRRASHGPLAGVRGAALLAHTELEHLPLTEGLTTS